MASRRAISSFGTGSDFNRLIERVVRMISNRSVPSIASGMASSLVVGAPRLCDGVAECKDRSRRTIRGSPLSKTLGEDMLNPHPETRGMSDKATGSSQIINV